MPKTGPPSVHNHLQLVRALGIETTATSYVGLVAPSASDLQWARDRLRQAGLDESTPYVLMAPAASRRRAVKEWPAGRFAELSRHVLELGYGVVVVGTNHLAEFADFTTTPFVDLTGETSLCQILALAQGATCFVGIDSGVMHLAAAVGCRCLGLFGPSDSRITGPQGEGHRVVRLGLDCSPCHASACDSKRCMEGLSVGLVKESLLDLLASDADDRHRPPPPRRTEPDHEE